MGFTIGLPDLVLGILDCGLALGVGTFGADTGVGTAAGAGEFSSVVLLFSGPPIGIRWWRFLRTVP